jgi:aerobic carbon-monoxide dehydrogenase small subunit
MNVEMTVNGKKVKADTPPSLLLSDFLRENLNLTGTHVGCDTSQCGACVVHIDGVSMKSCTLLTVTADGKSVTTIEGLAKTAGADLHPMQEAFHLNHGLQCGFCTPGFLTAITAALEQNPEPTEDEARDIIGGNLCRCTGYQNIVKAVLRAAELRAAELAGDLGGSPQSRPESDSAGSR